MGVSSSNLDEGGGGNDVPLLLTVKSGRWRVGRDLLCTFGKAWFVCRGLPANRRS